MFRGRLDVATRTRIAGWAQDDSLPHQAVALLILDNDTLLDRVIANHLRPDLTANGIGDGRHGFELLLENGLPGLDRHVIRVVRERDGAELAASPAVIERADAFDTPAQAALRGVLDGIDGPDRIDAAIAALTAEIDRLASRRPRHWDYRGLARFTRRALVIDAAMPAPGRDAGSNAILSHMHALTRLGYAVSFVAATLAPPGFDDPAIDWIAAPGIRSVEEALVRDAGAFDLVYLHRLDAAVRYLPLVRAHQPRARIIYSVADLHHLRLARRGFVEREPRLVAAARQVRATEFAIAGAVDAVITHSTAEASILRRAGPAQVHVVPWSVSVSRSSLPPPVSDHTIGFIGHFGHTPNLDAARRLALDIMPRLRAANPSITCLIAGSAMPAMMHEWAAPGVEMLGAIPDLAAFFARLQVTVAPMAYGAGVKGKVLDSLAAGLPCIATPVAIEGLNWPDSLASCVAADDAGIARAILRLLASPARQRRAAAAGRALVARDWSNAAVDAALGAICPRPKGGRITPETNRTAA